MSESTCISDEKVVYAQGPSGMEVVASKKQGPVDGTISLSLVLISLFGYWSVSLARWQLEYVCGVLDLLLFSPPLSLQPLFLSSALLSSIPFPYPSPL